MQYCSCPGQCLDDIAGGGGGGGGGKMVRGRSCGSIVLCERQKRLGWVGGGGGERERDEERGRERDGLRERERERERGREG